MHEESKILFEQNLSHEICGSRGSSLFQIRNKGNLQRRFGGPVGEAQICAHLKASDRERGWIPSCLSRPDGVAGELTPDEASPG